MGDGHRVGPGAAAWPWAGPASTGHRTRPGWSRSATRSTRSSGVRATPGRPCSPCWAGRRLEPGVTHRAGPPSPRTTSPPAIWCSSSGFVAGGRAGGRRGRSRDRLRGARGFGPGNPVRRPSVGSSVVLVLALDTATPTLVAGLARWSRRRRTSRCSPSGRCPRATGTPSCSRPRSAGVLADAGLAMADLDAVVTGLGPGPVHRAAGRRRHRRRARPTPAACRSSASARSTRSAAGARTVVTDARRKEVYWAAYAADGARIDGPGVVRPEELRRGRTVRRRPRVRRAAGRAGRRRPR